MIQIAGIDLPARPEGRMIRVINAKERHHRDLGWLSTYWHFSFDDYHDPDNMSWGALRVFNDDIIQPGQGFGFHPHRDMEIVTYVLDGELEHRDNQGNRGIVRPGEVQVMSAGTGIVHSEYNHSKVHPVHLLQLWILPRRKGVPPRWEQRQFTPDDRSGKLLSVVSGGDVPETLTIDQDAQIYVAALRAGQEVVHKSQPGRKAYLFMIAGGLTINGKPAEPGDQARIADEPELALHAKEAAELIFLDLP
jgi:redox-sensitive bicupin YhaK (pirin superfamily)